MVFIPFTSSGWNEGEGRDWNEERTLGFRHPNKLRNNGTESQVFNCKTRPSREERFSLIQIDFF